MNTLPKVSLPGYVDASMLSAYKSCPRLFYYKYLRHLQAVERSEHLVAGGAYARGLEVARLSYFRDKLSPEESLSRGIQALIKHWGDYEPPETSAKTLGNMMLALEEYFEHYGWKEDHIQPFVPDGSDQPAVEFSFALPLPINHPETGDPLLYTGRYDMIGQHMQGLWAVDEKTTQRLGPSWNKQWTLRSQFMGYVWAARQHGYPVMGAIVRGISILKYDFGHAEVIVQIPEHKIQLWYTTMIHTVSRMVQDWSHHEFLPDLDGACNTYSGCSFMKLCDKQEPERWVDTNFIKRIWNPLEAVE